MKRTHPDALRRIPWQAWLVLDLAAIVAIVLLTSLGMVTGREASGSIATVALAGCLSHFFQRFTGNGPGDGPFVPPSGVAALALCIPLFALFYARRA